jgi:4-amino-4-deoxy-L-arabinose transferase-like glycosyltransferase
MEATEERETAGVPAALVLVLALVFIVVTAVWLSIDARVPNGDSGRHMLFALGYLDRIKAGSLLAPLTETPIIDNQIYPPFVHTIGVIAFALGGVGVTQAVLAQNLIFVPLLALGCFGAGSVAFDRRAGALAAVFALSSPLVISLFHEFMIDTPQAALAAVSLWLLLLSGRFSRTWVSGLAGLAVALGMLTKPTFALFVAGAIGVLVVRGGWRNWRGLAVFGLVVAVLVTPWYARYFDTVLHNAKAAAGAGLNLAGGAAKQPARWSLGNFTWYGWSLVEVELYLPLFAFFVAGLIASAVRFFRDRLAVPHLPELLAGLAVAYLGISYLSPDDHRYLLPALVYIAVLGTGWIVRLPAPGRLVASAALVAIFALNMVTVNTPPDAGTTVSVGKQYISLGGSGYDVGLPDSRLKPFEQLLERARADGARQVVFQPESMNSGQFNLNGLAITARAAGLRMPGFQSGLLGPADVFVVRAPIAGNPAQPCFRLGDRTAIFMYKGPPVAGKPLYCPPT